jgi:serine/threonine protein kinase, bacterial
MCLGLLWKQLERWICDRPLKGGEVIHPAYTIEHCFGKGGYGIVYLCKDVHTQRTYALKQLRPSKAGKAKETDRFQKEIEMLARMEHKQIPRLIHHSVKGEKAYYVMEHVEGMNLEERLFLEKQTFTERESLLIFSRLLTIVDYLHEQNIFHGDIRPPNILMNAQEVYLIDFGLAEKVSSEDSEESSVRRQDDFFDLGEVLLFLLYSQFTGKKDKRKSWLEELTLHKETESLIKRLLGISQIYAQVKNIREDAGRALQALGVGAS